MGGTKAERLLDNGPKGGKKGDKKGGVERLRRKRRVGRGSERISEGEEGRASIKFRVWGS